MGVSSSRVTLSDAILNGTLIPAQIAEKDAIAPERILIQIGHLKLVYHSCIGSFGATVANHRGHILPRLYEKDLMVTFICRLF